ncbi:hypothetical protein [Lacrimispora saccharolytica]|uniref:hypothetical protein n=1 Tax=Lacrimispora saccharolytica TaxID=84030 RepID=UPI0003036CEF|nr:hypothetical protein [Lacrimispora saccharolytica]QRV20353.1 hypothetical protein I6K70_02025 [Lacrimispora saccharolytica]
MFAYALLKGVRLEILPEKSCLVRGEEIYLAVETKKLICHFSLSKEEILDNCF